jgi:hypothetical protein
LAGCVSSCLETIEVIDPFFQSVCSAANHGWGICSIRIDFQLGTNGGDANGFDIRREGLFQNEWQFAAREVSPCRISSCQDAADDERSVAYSDGKLTCAH